MNHPIESSDLDWLAFCYAAGELDAAAAEQFEARLATEQPAREALSRAVELTQTVSAAEHQLRDFAVPGMVVPGMVVPANRSQSDWNLRLSWMAVGGLASVLAALLWSGVVGPSWQTAKRGQSAGDKQDLALAWHETGVEIANVKEAGLWPYSRVAGQEEYEPLGLAESDADGSELMEAPSWMMAAVFGSSDASGTDPTSGQFE